MQLTQTSAAVKKNKHAILDSFKRKEDLVIGYDGDLRFSELHKPYSLPVRRNLYCMYNVG
jgi:hypothetical protein